jgi:hypothetical protein
MLANLFFIANYREAADQNILKLAKSFVRNGIWETDVLWGIKLTSPSKWKKTPPEEDDECIKNLFHFISNFPLPFLDYEVHRLGGQHRMMALQHPLVQDHLAKNNITIATWKCLLLSEELLSFENVDEMLNCIQEFDNLQHSGNNSIRSCDTERALTIAKQLSLDSFKHWQHNLQETCVRLLSRTVCNLFAAFC